jgi:hypothetical protein
MAEQAKKEFPKVVVSAVEKILYLTLYDIIEPLANSGKTYAEIAKIQLRAIEEIPSSAREAIKSHQEPTQSTLRKSA